jgi:hypothetical protein
VEIIKHGPKMPKKFSCPGCACEFVADFGEWKSERQEQVEYVGTKMIIRQWTDIVCRCPDCGWKCHRGLEDDGSTCASIIELGGD